MSNLLRFPRAAIVRIDPANDADAIIDNAVDRIHHLQMQLAVAEEMARSCEARLNDYQRQGWIRWAIFAAAFFVGCQVF